MSEDLVSLIVIAELDREMNFADAIFRIPEIIPVLFLITAADSNEIFFWL